MANANQRRMFRNNRDSRLGWSPAVNSVDIFQFPSVTAAHSTPSRRSKHGQMGRCVSDPPNQGPQVAGTGVWREISSKFPFRARASGSRAPRRIDLAAGLLIMLSVV